MEAIKGLWAWMGHAERREEGLGLSKTFPQQFLASLKTGSWLSREPPAVFPEPPYDVCCACGGWGCTHTCGFADSLEINGAPSAYVCVCASALAVELPEARACVLHVPKCGLTHLSRYGEQTGAAWCICESGSRCWA